MDFHGFSYKYGQLILRFDCSNPSEALKSVAEMLERFPQSKLGHVNGARVEWPDAIKAVADGFAPVEEAPKTRRTRSPAVEVPAAEVAEAPRRRTRKTEDKPADISDYDLSKAASEAAEKHGIDTVLGVLQDFKVKRVNELAQADRPVFLDQLVNGLGNS